VTRATKPPLSGGFFFALILYHIFALHEYRIFTFLSAFIMRWSALKYGLPLLIYAATIRAMLSHGWSVFLPVIIAFAVIPLLELFIRSNPANLSEAEESMAKNDPVYDWLVYAIVPLQYTTLFLFLQGFEEQQWAWWEAMGRTLAMGLACGTFGINVGHELGHRSKWYEQWMAKALLLTSMYTHFFIEHNKGHHKHVATPADPSSAPYYQSLYRFWVRSISGVYRDAWKIANAELRKKQKPFWQNEMLQLQLIQLGFIILILTAFGTTPLLYFFAAAFIGILLLESVNYIEHYGLRRKQTEANQYERAMPVHSWNSSHVLGRMVLFELSRHSDHHFLASRKYQILRHHADAPQLPTGYPGSILLAAVPPLWFAVMDKQMKKYGLFPAAPSTYHRAPH
jgi:alkane 1-monooxygenase